MPYKDKEKLRIAQHNHYINNKAEYLARRTKIRNEIKKWFREFAKNDVCKFCPESDSCCIDYHHLDPNKKDLSISRLINDYSNKDKILAEYQKCIPVCSNCHRKIHAGKIIVT